MFRRPPFCGVPRRSRDIDVRFANVERPGSRSRYAPVSASYYRTVIPADVVARAAVTLRSAFRLGRTLMCVRGAYYLRILCDTSDAARG